MAVYNELQVGRYVRFFQKVFSIKGRQPAPLQFSGEISAFLSLFHGVENRFLEAWNQYHALVSLGASVGNVNMFRFRNPAASNVVIVLEKIRVLNGGAGLTYTISWQQLNTDLVTPFAFPGNAVDFRQSALNPTLIASTSQPAAGTDLTNIIEQLTAGVAAGSLGYADMILDEDQELTMAPGTCLQIRDGTVNAATACSLKWRERSLEESERQ